VLAVTFVNFTENKETISNRIRKEFSGGKAIKFKVRFENCVGFKLKIRKSKLPFIYALMQVIQNAAYLILEKGKKKEKPLIY